MAPSSVESIQEDVITDNFSSSNVNNRSPANNSNTEATNMSFGEANDEHSRMEQQPLAVTPIVNIDDVPVATRNSLRRIASVPATDDFHNSFEQLSLDVSPSQAQCSPSLPRTGTMLMREQQDQLMTTLLSSVSAVLRLLKNSSEVSELMTAAQSMSMLCGRGVYVCVGGCMCLCVYACVHLYVFMCVCVCICVFSV